jgi:vacuolar-type H+-ATPase subunit F/Vma7
MPEQKIHIIGYDEIVLLFGLLGINGTIVEETNKFMEKFQDLIKDPSIGMIIIAMELPDEIVDYLIDYKLNNRKPFVFQLPDIFKADIEEEDAFLKRIYDSIKKII